MNLNVATVGFLFLLAVIVQSLPSGFLPAAIVSLLAAALLDYFFIPPVFAWGITDPLDVVAFVSFLATALVITRLASRARDEARRTHRQSREFALLYEAAQQLLCLEPDAAGTSRGLGVFVKVFNLRAACLFDAGTAEIQIEGNSLTGLAETTRQAYIADKNYDDAPCGVTVRCLRVGSKSIGAIGFEGLSEPEWTAGPLSALAAT